MVLTSFKSETRCDRRPACCSRPRSTSYREVFARADYFDFALNSVVISVGGTVLALVFAIPAAYAMAFHPTERTRGTLLWMLSTKMLPPVGVLVPIYLLFRTAGLLDTRSGLIMIYALMNLPIVVWMLFTFYKEVPNEILEAGRMDGARTWGEVWYLLLPLTLPGVASTGLLSLILCWNEAFWSLNLTSAGAAPLTAFIASFSSPEGLFFAKLSAASTMAVAPILVFGWFSQRQLVQRPDVRRGEVRRPRMATLTLRDMRKSYGPVEVIKGVDLDIADREFVVFVGPSGCGKSTLLRMIAGLEEITSGDLLIDGKRVNEVGPADRGLAMVFQSYALYPHMTVRQNMGFALRLARVPRAERDRKVEEAARILQLEPYLERRPKELSGGQRQRVAIGRAIVRNPRCSCSTSRCPTSTPRCAARCASNWRGCTRNSTRR